VKGDLRRALFRGRHRPRLIGVGSPTAIRGDGYEFAELREYVAGDDPRRIDWAATARAGALQTRVVLEDVALTLAAVVDDSPSMRLGRDRPLFQAAREAVQAWYGAALTDDRCMRVTAAGLYAPHGLRGPRSALACANAPTTRPFELRAALEIARAALPAGAALLVISDFLDVDTLTDVLLLRLGTRFDCTALIARDPWFESLPLRGFVVLGDAETESQRRLYIGPKERQRYREAVRRREDQLCARLDRSGWRTGILHEVDGERSLFAAFGL